MPDRVITIRLQDGGIELVKWLSLLFMVLDHVNKYLFNYSIEYFYEIGRVAMPLFGIILAYNLARPSISNIQQTLTILIKRLVIFGLLATPAFIILGGVKYGWWPLNILFTFAVSISILLVIELRQKIEHSWLLILLIFLVGGSLVEFWWPAIALVVSGYLFFKTLSYKYLFVVALSFVGLCYINSNLYAILALPIFLIGGNINLRIIRLRWVFYGFYVLHFVALYLIRIPMTKAGYIFLI